MTDVRRAARRAARVAGYDARDAVDAVEAAIAAIAALTFDIDAANKYVRYAQYSSHDANDQAADTDTIVQSNPADAVVAEAVGVAREHATRAANALAHARESVAKAARNRSSNDMEAVDG